MESIYHICSKCDWDNSKKEKDFRAGSLNSEGFIHCSTIQQIPRVLKTFFDGQQNLVILKIEIEHLVPELRWEPGQDKGDELFPHVYGPLNKSAILKIFEVDEDLFENLELPGG